MHADTAGAALIARIAVGFDWTWKLSDVTEFSQAVGWQSAVSTPMGLRMVTNLEVLRRESYAFIDRDGESGLSALGQQVECIVMHVADVDNASHVPTESEIADCHSLICEALTVGLGLPTRRTYGENPATRWELPDVVIEVLSLTNTVDLSLVNPSYQDWLDHLEFEGAE